MAKTKSSKEATLPTKCKAQDHNNSPLKAPKIMPQDEIEDNEENQMSKSNNLGTLVPESKTGDQEPKVDAEEDKDGDYEEDEDDDEGDAQVDKKRKGILIEEEDDDKDDDDDSSDGKDDESNAESDLSDNPLAEVDSDDGGFIAVGERRECRGNSFQN
ncbi:hypothetical protein SLA2020_063780 [Shorea laevis]